MRGGCSAVICTRYSAGVYAVGHPGLGVLGRWRAATLAVGRDSVLSHRSAAAFWDLRAHSGRHELTVRGARRGQLGLRLYRDRLVADELVERDGIRVTTVARTLLDLAPVLNRDRLAAVVGRAEERLLADSPSLPELIERHRGARGLGALRAVLADSMLGTDVPASELEIEFAGFLRRRGLPGPRRNVWIEADGRSYEVDCLWEGAGLAVELDSRAFHHNVRSFESERARDAALLSIGVTTIRVTARRLRGDASRLERQLRLALSRRASGRSPGAGSRSCPRRSG